MSSGYCPSCGAEYRLGVTICPDCEVAVVPSDDPAVTTAPALGQNDEDEVLYELADWAPQQRVLLGNALTAAGILHLWEEGDLVVNQADEERVEAMLDEMEGAEVLQVDDERGLDEDDDGGLAAQEAMGELFVAADRLMHEPDDLNLAGDLVEAAETVNQLAAPYGIDPGAWVQIGELASVVRDSVATGADTDVVARDARTLREVLRRYV